jgi:hypothetical protein
VKKIFKEIFDSAWLWVPAGIVMAIVFGYFYYKTHYCKQLPCIRQGRECIQSHIETNDMMGKYHREWVECDEYRYYEYASTYDSCGCTKLK